VVIVGSLNVNQGFKLIGNAQYPMIAEDYQKTFRVLKSLPCDIFLGAHGEYYGMVQKYERAKKGTNANPFVDAEGYNTYIAQKEKAYHEALAAQR
jgi:metallo-beta-lactamase class B